MDEAIATEAMHFAIERCREGKAWHPLLIDIFPGLTIGEMEALIKGKKDWHIIDNALVIEDMK